MKKLTLFFILLLASLNLNASTTCQFTSQLIPDTVSISPDWGDYYFETSVSVFCPAGFKFKIELEQKTVTTTLNDGKVTSTFLGATCDSNTHLNYIENIGTGEQQSTSLCFRITPTSDARGESIIFYPSTLSLYSIEPGSCKPKQVDYSKPEWNENSIYNTNDIVLHKDQNYKAKYWTQGNIPTAGGPWILLSDSWSSVNSYNAKSIVVHNGRKWRAKWWTEGDEPGTNEVWELLSGCN
ncbi:carbohydrate-binding protein [Photobacterium leiognathi]|uniref:carbohydrate-binding protein n=1 Tax=Photobacterium leiognathi TaxID=553611 RepID=UPI0029810A3C|nr:carbohydrate-binding protein [Photobacterium leiognathi]